MHSSVPTVKVPDFDALMTADGALGEAALKSLVAPYYLKLMGTGIARADDRLLRSVGRSSRRVTDEQVLLMLQGTWRPLVMGAWYAIARNDSRLTVPVHDALESCLGHLTSPALITATLFYPSPRTSALLQDYAAVDRERSWGMSQLAEVAIQHLESPNSLSEGADSQQASAQLRELLLRGDQLRRLHIRRWQG